VFTRFQESRLEGTVAATSHGIPLDIPVDIIVNIDIMKIRDFVDKINIFFARNYSNNNLEYTLLKFCPVVQKNHKMRLFHPLMGQFNFC